MQFTFFPIRLIPRQLQMALLLILYTVSCLNIRIAARHRGVQVLPLTTLRSSAVHAGARDGASLEWYEMDGCQVLFPNERVPKSIVHFIGGFIAGSAVRTSYESLLEAIAANGHLVVATELPAFERDHARVAINMKQQFTACFENSLVPNIGQVCYSLPVVGISHSLGGKITCLIDAQLGPGITARQRKIANIFLAFNNYGPIDSLDIFQSQSKAMGPEIVRVFQAVISAPEIQAFIKLAKSRGIGPGLEKTIIGAVEDAIGPGRLVDTIRDQVKGATSKVNDFLEFIPSSTEMWSIIRSDYRVRQNYVVNFKDDTIDQSPLLIDNLTRRGCTTRILRLEGNHLSPLGIEGVQPELDATLLRRLLAILSAVSDPKCDFDFSALGRPAFLGSLSLPDGEHDNY